MTERGKDVIKLAIFTLTVWFVVVAVMMVWLLLQMEVALARDPDARYANSPLKPWFDSLKSAKGPCCSDADGTALSDVDWESHDGKYRVRIEGLWIDVPEGAILKQPNLYGRTMVWPIYNRSMGVLTGIDIRCFIPGAML